MTQRVVVPLVVATAVKEVSPSFPAGIPQNVPEKAMNGAAEASLDQKLEIGIIQKLGSGFAQILSIPIQFPTLGLWNQRRGYLVPHF